MKAEILSIGTELLLGEIVDTNASYLAARLPLLGIDLYWVTQVRDDREKLREALSRAWGRSDLIFTTGGLGPTEDDLTREAIAEVLGEELKVDSKLLQELENFFLQRGFSMPSHNIKQATLISSAQALPNPRGTAPGWWVEREGKIIVAMPGPPGEMQHMWENEVEPRLRQRPQEAFILSRTLKTFRLGEALVDEMVAPLVASANPTIGIYSKPDGIHVRLTAKASTQQAAEGIIAQSEARLREILGNHIWGVDNDTLESLIGALLTQRGFTLATMESCTGGLVANTLTDIPGSSAYYKGGLVAYSDEVKIAFGVDAQLIAQHGAVSPEVAEAMAEAARQRLAADFGAGITGVAGPEESQGTPPGTVHIVVTDGKSKKELRGTYPPYRLEVKRRATMAVLFGLRELLLSLD